MSLGLLAVLVCAGTLAAQTGSVVGRVWGPNGRPVIATVEILGTSLQAVSDNTGRYCIENVPAGTHTLRAKAAAFSPVDITDVVVASGDSTRVNIGVGPRPQDWAILEDSLLLGPAPSRRITLFVDSLGVVPTPGDAAHRQQVSDSLALRGLAFLSDSGGLMVFGITAAASWDTLAARDSVFRVADGLRRALPGLVRQAGPLVRYRPAGAAFVATDEVVVRFDGALSYADIAAINHRVGARPAYSGALVANEFLVQAFDRDGIALSNAYWAMVGSPAVRSAYPNFRARSFPTNGPGGEPLSGDQWHLERINVAPAWPLATGTVVVGVIEQDGFEITHPDLKGRLWTSADAGADADGDRLVGEQSGWNFSDCAGTASLANAQGMGAFTGPPATCGEPGLTTRGGTPTHGTAVAGLVAADRNGEGLIGVCPGCRLMLVVVDGMNLYSLQLGFQYVEVHGAQVVNLSQHLGTALDELPPDFDGLLRRIAQTRPMVVSIGNEDQDFCAGAAAGFPAIPGVIPAGASNQRDKRIAAGYGDCLSVLAPAGRGRYLVGVTTTDVTGTPGRNSEYGEGCTTSEFRLTDVPKRDYTKCFGGTSAAAPIVSGVVGLMLAAQPNLGPTAVKDILQTTADKIQRGSANYDAGGKSLTHGYGRVNACAAVHKAVGDPQWQEKCARTTPWYCIWWVWLLIALFVGVVVGVIVYRVRPAGSPGRLKWAVVAGVIAAVVVFVLLWLLCRWLN